MSNLKFFLSLVFTASLLAGLMPELKAQSRLHEISHLEKGNALAYKGNYQQAVREYQMALRDDPHNTTVFHMYGRTLALMGNYPAAVAQYRLASKLAPENAELFNDLGLALFFSEEVGDAIVEFRKAIAVNGKFVAAYNNLGEALTKQGDFKAAISAFQSSLKLDPTNQTIKLKLAQAQAYDQAENDGEKKSPPTKE